MGIDVNAKSNTSPEDKEVLARVYQTQLDEYMRAHHEHATTAQELQAEIGPLQRHLEAETRQAAVLEGKADELRRIAARDGITLD
jgi:predicted RNase H-like nuclease (RuvC/YqgF family)